MKTRVKWVENVSVVGETGSGHAIVIDGAPESGGRDVGPRPMELFLTGATACTAYDVVTILRKERQPIADCVVDAHAERAETPPRVFTRVHFKYTVAGRGLDPQRVEHAVRLSHDTYCSATQMLAKTAAVTHEIVIVDADRVPGPS